MNKARLRIEIEIVGTVLNVRLRMSDAEKEEALAECPELASVLNDAMSNLRRRYALAKIPTRGEAARLKILEIAARLRRNVEEDERASGLSVEIRALYQEQVAETRSIEA